MTSMRSSFNLLRYLRYQLRENLWLIFVLGLVYVLLGPAVMFVMLSGRLSQLHFSGETLQNPVLLTDLSSIVHFDAWLPLYATAIVVGVILAMVVSGYLNSRRQTNFYHSLPVRRGQWLMAQISGGIAIHSIILLVNLALFFLVAVVILPPHVLHGSWFLIHFLQIELIFLVSFLLTLLAGQLTGNGLAQLAMTAVLQLAPLVIAWVLMLVFTTQFITYVQVDWLNGMSRWSLPSLILNYATDSHLLYGSSGIVAPWLSRNNVLGLLLVAVMALLLIALLYRRMASERVSDTLLFDWVALPVKAFFLFCAPLLMGLFFLVATNDRLPTFFVGFILAGVLTHVLIEIAFHQNVHSVRQHAPSSLAILMVVLLFFLGCRIDIAGFNTYLPAEDKIAAMQVSSASFRNDSAYPGNYPEKEYGLKDKAAIEKAHDLAEKATEGFLEREEVNQGVTRAEDTRTLDHLYVAYQLKNGRTVTRDYSVPREAVEAEAAALYDEETFRLNLWDVLFDTHPEDIAHLSVTVRSFLTDPFMDGTGQHYLFAQGTGFFDGVPENTTNRLLNALRQDIAERSYADLNSDTLAMVQIGSHKGGPGNGGWMQSVPVLENDHHTLAILEELSDNGLFTMEEDRLLEEGITEVALARSVPIIPKPEARQESSGPVTLEGQEGRYEEIVSTRDSVTIADWLLHRSLGYYRLSEFGVVPAPDLVFLIRTADGTEYTRPVHGDRVPEMGERSVT